MKVNIGADPRNYEFMDSSKCGNLDGCDGITILKKKRGATESDKTVHYRSEWNQWSMKNMTTITKDNLNGFSISSKPIGWGDGKKWKAPYAYTLVRGTIKHDFQCVRMKGIDVLYVILEDRLYQIQSKQVPSPKEAGSFIAGVFIDARNPNPDNIDSKGRYVCSIRDKSAYQTKDSYSFSYKEAKSFIAYVKDPKQYWEINFINNDIPIDVFIPCGYNQSNFGKRATSNTQPFAGYHNDYAGNINLILNSNCLCQFTLYDNDDVSKSWTNNPPDTCVTNPDQNSIPFYTRDDWRHKESGAKGSGEIWNPGGIHVFLNKSKYCDPSMNNASSSICQGFLSNSDIIQQYTDHCKKLDDKNDPYKNIYSIVNGMDCIGFSNNPKNISFKSGTGGAQKGFDSVISDMCQDSNITSIYKEDSDQLKKIKQICGCFPLGYTDNFKKLQDDLKKENQKAIPSDCNQTCTDGSNDVYMPLSRQACSMEVKNCIQKMKVLGSSIKAENFHQACTETGSDDPPDKSNDLPNDTSDPSDPNLKNKDPPSKPTKSSTTTIIVIIIFIILLLFGLIYSINKFT